MGDHEFYKIENSVSVVQSMTSIRLNARGLIKILVIVPIVTIILVLLFKGKSEPVGDIRCSQHQRRQNVKCPSVGKTIPPQSNEVIRVVCLSDTHGHHASVHIPHGDIFIHGGDILDLSRKNWTGQVLSNKVVIYMNKCEPIPLTVG